MIALRPFAPTDAAAVAALSARWFDPDPALAPAEVTARLTADALGGGSHVQVAVDRAVDGDRVVGVVGFVRSASMLMVWPLAADDEAAAAALLDAALTAGRAPGLTAARVSTRSVEPHKRRAVERRGFARSIDFVQVRRASVPPLAAPSVLATPRRGAAIDRAAMHALHELSFATLDNTAPMSSADFDELLDDPAAWPAATAAWHDDTGACVGFVIGLCAPDHRVVEAIGVAPAWRGRGLGQAILADVLRVAAADGEAEVRAMIASTNAASLALHARAGFVERARKELWDLAL